jgi:hypothetical protein
MFFLAEYKNLCCSKEQRKNLCKIGYVILKTQNMKTQESVYKQHEENTEWSSKLDFYKDEVTILTGRLKEIASKNSSAEAMVDTERFQNQLMIQENAINEISHLIKNNEKVLELEVDKNPVAIDHRKVEYHTKEQNLIVGFEKNFKELRADFNRFAAKWM